MRESGSVKEAAKSTVPPVGRTTRLAASEPDGSVFGRAPYTVSSDMSMNALVDTSGESSVRRTYLTLRTSAGRWWRLPRCAEENLPATAVVKELPSDDVSILKSRVEAPAGSPHVFVGS